MSRLDILGIPVDSVTMEQAVTQFDAFVRIGGFHTIATPNPEIIMLAQTDKEMARLLREEIDLVVPDGIGVVIASRLLKTPSLPERVPGFDLIQHTMQQAESKGYRYYFLGGKPGVAELAREKMMQKYPGIQIVGCRDGYFKEEDTAAVIEAINESRANVLLVCLGAPKQEKWMVAHQEALPYIRVAIGAGGSLDGMAGIVQRAPVCFQKLGLEWFYRLLKQPSRWRRMLVLPQFLIKIIRIR